MALSKKRFRGAIGFFAFEELSEQQSEEVVLKGRVRRNVAIPKTYR